MYKIQRDFIWRGKSAKIKDSTPCNGYEKGGIKNVAFRNKITSTQCSCLKRLFEDNFHDWKVIPLFLIRHFYQDIKWINNYTAKPTLPLLLLLLSLILLLLLSSSLLLLLLLLLFSLLLELIPLLLIGKHLGKNFKFRNNIYINNYILSKFPSSYQDIKWINNYTAKILFHP